MSVWNLFTSTVGLLTASFLSFFKSSFFLLFNFPFNLLCLYNCKTVSGKHLNSISQKQRKIIMPLSICATYIILFFTASHCKHFYLSESFHFSSFALHSFELYCPCFPSFSLSLPPFLFSPPLPSSHLIYPQCLSSSLLSASFILLHFSSPYIINPFHTLLPPPPPFFLAPLPRTWELTLGKEGRA